MLPKSKRLNLTHDFKWVAQGVRRDISCATLFLREGENNIPKIGVALKKEYFRKAHDRNAAKRIAFAAIEKIYSSLRNNINLVIMPKTNILNKTPETVKSELAGAKDLF